MVAIGANGSMGRLSLSQSIHVFVVSRLSVTKIVRVYSVTLASL